MPGVERHTCHGVIRFALIRIFRSFSIMAMCFLFSLPKIASPALWIVYIQTPKAWNENIEKCVVCVDVNFVEKVDSEWNAWSAAHELILL